MNKQIKNIIKIYSRSTQIERDEGLAWYPHAREKCEQLAVLYNYPIETIVGILAALSPRCRWRDNLIDCERLLINDDNSVMTYGQNKMKAIAIKHGRLTPIDCLGQKTLSFFNSILGDHNSVCIDGHMYCVCVGKRKPLAELPNIGKTAYNFMVDCFRVSAKKIGGISPRDLQATTWIVWKNLHGIR